jgi:hypothetical protein
VLLEELGGFYVIDFRHNWIVAKDVASLRRILAKCKTVSQFCCVHHPGCHRFAQGFRGRAEAAMLLEMAERWRRLAKAAEIKDEE